MLTNFLAKRVYESRVLRLPIFDSYFRSVFRIALNASDWVQKIPPDRNIDMAQVKNVIFQERGSSDFVINAIPGIFIFSY